jgi:hypothetical protein
MPLLEAQDKTPYTKEDFKIPRPVMEDLTLYAQMTDSDPSHVVVQALLYVFGKDADFKKWKEQNPATNVAEISNKKSNAGRPKKNSAENPVSLSAAS